MLHPRGWVGFAVVGALGLAVRKAHAEPTASFDVAPAQPAATGATAPAPSAPSPTPSAPVTAPVATAATSEPPAPLPHSIDEAKAPVGSTPPARFGAAGQWAITGALDGWVSYSTGNRASRIDVYVHPAIDYFVAQHVSLGAQLNFRYTDENYPLGFTKTTRFGGGILFGYEVSFGERSSLWPRAFVGYSTGHVISPPVCTYAYCTLGYESDTHGVTTSLSLPLLFHVVPHFFLGGGPEVGSYFSTASSADDPTLFITLGMMLGGWF